MALTITKLANDNVEVTGGAQAYTLQPKMHTFRDKSAIDGVKVISEGQVKGVFAFTNIVNVIRQDGIVVPITDGDTLYTELKDFFFFIPIEGITLGYDLYFPSNVTEPLNTANQINGTTGGGSFISFVDLTGVTITSTVGTGVLTKVGNDLVFTTTGYIRKIILDDNGTPRIYSIIEGEGFSLNSTDYLLVGTLNGCTWTPGVDTVNSENTQTALLSYNNYPYFKAQDYVAITPVTIQIGEPIIVQMLTYPANYDGIICGDSLDNNTFILVDHTNGILYRDGGASTLTFTPMPVDGMEYEYRKINATTIELYGDGVLLDTQSGTLGTFRCDQFLRRFNLNDYLEGTPIHIKIASVDYTPWNQWNNSTINGTPSRLNLIEDINNVGFDLLGKEITRPLIANGRNYANQVHWFDSAIIPERDNVLGDNDQLFFKLNANNQFICGDDVWNLTTNGTGFLVSTYNGTILTTTFQPLVDMWVYVNQSVLLTDRTLDIGTISEFPTTPATTFSDTVVRVAATTEMIYGNVDKVGISLNGYDSQMAHHPFALTLAQKLNDWNFAKNSIPLIMGLLFYTPLNSQYLPLI